MEHTDDEFTVIKKKDVTPKAPSMERAQDIMGNIPTARAGIGGGPTKSNADIYVDTGDKIRI